MSWVRLWLDMPNDPKWRVIARRASLAVTNRHCDVTLSQVIAVFDFMLVNAGGWKNWGVLENWNDEVIAASLEIETDQVSAIREAMQGLILDGDRLINWEKRQTKQADSSAERTAEWRRRKRDGSDDSVTLGDDSETLCDAEEKRLEKKKRKDARAREAPSEVAPTPASRKTWPNGRTNGHATEDALMATKFTAAELERHNQTHKIYVKRETPAGEAWAEWARKNTGRSQVWDAKGGWYFPSELPPRSPNER